MPEKRIPGSGGAERRQLAAEDRLFLKIQGKECSCMFLQGKKVFAEQRRKVRLQRSYAVHRMNTKRTSEAFIDGAYLFH